MADRVTELKNEANKLFGQQKYGEAIEKFTEALALTEDGPLRAILLGNRSASHLRLESYGSAIEDADLSVLADPSYAKAYFRRACAYISLGKYDLALVDFQKVVTMCPKDKSARQRLETCKIARRRSAFEEAIASDSTPFYLTLQPDSMVVESGYEGPHLPEEITLEFVLELKEFYKNQGRLHTKYLYQILLRAIELLKASPSLVEVSSPPGGEVTVFGDIHGQYYDLLNVFEINGLPSPNNPCIFNGDLVDRGSFSVEVIVLVLAFKLLYPNHVHIARGNHETKSMNKVYGFEGEIRAKHSEKAYEVFSEVFCALPLAHVINKKVFVCHGGLFQEDGVTLEKIRRLDRNQEPPDQGVMCDLLWADPAPEHLRGRQHSKRGVSIMFGSDVTQRFLDDNNLDLVVRSHEVRDEGYSLEHNNKLITIFSAPNYCDQYGNKGAIVKFGEDNKPKFTQFVHVPHPNVPPMAYASMMNQMGM